MRNTKIFENKTYDLLVIGGGINGAAIAHMAALNGYMVALIEKNDFGSGTSSKSTKLIHGGLRYLEQFDFGLVQEALHERHVQCQSAPHIVQPIQTVIPVYRSDKRPLWMIKLGVSLYDFLSGKYVLEKHKPLSPEEITAMFPGINKTDLIGGVMYTDAQMDDARLVLENVLKAKEYGADVANYVEAASINKENGKIVGVNAVDVLNGETFEIKAKKTICTVGPWTNEFIQKEKGQSPDKIRTTKGVHIVHRGSVSDKALFVTNNTDKRIFFIIPWFENSLIGTTDTDYTESPDDVDVEENDVQYLLDAASRVFPDNQFNKEGIITTFAGLRPLVMEDGSPSNISRKHVIEESFTGIFYVMGGKYTTYRKIAEDAIKKVFRKTPKDTSEYFPVYGSGEIEDDLKKKSAYYDVDLKTIEYLIEFYGTRYEDVLRVIEKDPMLKAPLCADLPMIKAQVIYSREYEMAQNPEDVVFRRLSLNYHDVVSATYLSYINAVFAMQ